MLPSAFLYFKENESFREQTVAQKTEKVIQVLLRAAWKKAELTRVNGSFKKNNVRRPIESSFPFLTLD